jgi:hypothetical protein
MYWPIARSRWDRWSTMSSAVEPRTPAIVIEDQATAARMLLWDSILDRIRPEDTAITQRQADRIGVHPMLKGGN